MFKYILLYISIFTLNIVVCSAAPWDKPDQYCDVDGSGKGVTISCLNGVCSSSVTNHLGCPDQMPGASENSGLDSEEIVEPVSRRQNHNKRAMHPGVVSEESSAEESLASEEDSTTPTSESEPDELRRMQLEDLREKRAAKSEKAELRAAREHFESTAAQYEQAALEAEKTCVQESQRGELCCNSPLSCLKSGDGLDAKQTMNIGMGTQMGLQIIQMIQMSKVTDPAEACRLSRKMSTVTTVLNTAMAGICATKKNSCSRTCGSALQTAESALRNCKNAARSAGLSNPGMACGQVDDIVAGLEKSVSDCSGLAAQATQASAMAAQGIIATKANQACEAQGVNKPPEITDFPGSSVASTDCNTQANLNSPFCITQRCALPAFANDPVCKQYTGYNSTSSSSTGDDDLVGIGEDIAVIGDEGDPYEQGINAGDNDQANNFEVGSGARGGGSLSGGSSGGSGGGSSRSGGPAASSDTNVKSLFGKARGGSGHSRSYGRRSGGAKYSRNYGGQGRGGRARARAKKKSFNLSAYLPGRSKYGKRKLASVRTKERAGIAAKHKSIWDIISTRYTYECRTKQLKGCQ